MEHSLQNARLQAAMPGFWTLELECSCGTQHFMLLLTREVEIGLKVMSELRAWRKEQDDAVLSPLQAEPADGPEDGSLHMGT